MASVFLCFGVWVDVDTCVGGLIGFAHLEQAQLSNETSVHQLEVFS